MSRRRFTAEQDREIATRYLAGESSVTLARAFGLPRPNTIQNTLMRLGVTMRTALVEPRLTEAQRDEAVLAIIAGNGTIGGDTICTVAARYGVSKQTMDGLLRQHGVTLKTGRPVIHVVNHAAFDVLTPEALYWLGFLFADGHIAYGNGEPHVVLSLGIKDRVHVEKFKRFVGSSRAIYINKPGPKRVMGGGTCAYLAVRSRRICENLQRYGMTLKRARGPVAEAAQSRDFWRGAVDGDGWIGTQYVQGRIYPYVGLSGQASVVVPFCNFIRERGIARLAIGRTDSGIWKTSTSGRTANEIIRVLYEDATEVLDRKNDRARAILAGDLRLFPAYVGT